jgi:hypothetical protein
MYSSRFNSIYRTTQKLVALSTPIPDFTIKHPVDATEEDRTRKGSKERILGLHIHLSIW